MSQTIEGKLAEYIALYLEDSQDFKRMNQLSFELAMRLPAYVYQSIGETFKQGGIRKICELISMCREYCLSDRSVREKDILTPEYIIWHQKGIGKKNEHTDQRQT